MMSFAGPEPGDLSVIQADEQAIARCIGSWLDPQGRFLRALPASVCLAERRETLQSFAVVTARYVIPTLELIEWLRNEIGERSALEICAGQGDLGHHLGIRMVDDYQQTKPMLADYYRLLGQAPTSPPPDVREMDAVKAVRKFKPDVVVGGFVTHRFFAGMAGGNQYGPIEEEIIEACSTYIMIGNERTHADKPILKLPHRTYKFPWLVTRARFPEANAIFVWSKQ